MTPTTIHYNTSGYEAVFFPDKGECVVTVRGYVEADGKIIERGGPANPGDTPIVKFTLTPWAECPAPLFSCDERVRMTFEDALWNRKDLLGAPMFRLSPNDDAERRRFKSACDAAMKIRDKMSTLGVGKVLFTLPSSLFTTVDCFARDSSGAFWLIGCTTDIKVDIAKAEEGMSVAAYALVAGGYVPRNATVNLGVWSVLCDGPRFTALRNDPVGARDVVVKHLLSVSF